jgi:hypothetical protein
MPAPQPLPPAPAPIDYDKMAESSIRVAKAQTLEEEAAIKRLYPEYIGMQFGTADRLAGKLNNQYLAQLRNTITQEMGAAATPNAIEAELQRRASADLATGPTAADRQIQQAGLGAMGARADQISGPSNIREISAANVQSGQVGAGGLGYTLMAQAMRRAQGEGRLSAEASRDATQAARAGMAARGMATGSAGLGAELLNRDRFSRARMAEDNAFAQSVQGQDVERQFANVANRMRADQGNQEVSARMAMSNQQRDQVLAQMSMQAQMANQSANQNQTEANRAFMLNANTAFQGAEMNRRNMALGANQMDLARRQRRIGLAGAYGDLDPFRQAIGPAFGLGQSTLANTTGQVGNIYGGSLAQAGNVASFNTNMLASNRNAVLNNNAAMQAAAMQAGAQQNAGMMGMFGGIGSGVASGAGLAIAGASF